MSLFLSVSPFLSSFSLSAYLFLVLVSLSLALRVSPSSLLSARVRACVCVYVCAWAVRACACPRRVRRVVVPKEPREYVSILEGVAAGGAETTPALAVVLLVDLAIV